MTYFKLVRDPTDNKLFRDGTTQKAIVYPDTWTVSFSSIGVTCAGTCKLLTPSGSAEVDLGGFNPSDTFTINRNNPTVTPCLWDFVTSATVTIKQWNNNFCFFVPDRTSVVPVTVRLTKVSGGWLLEMIAISGTIGVPSAVIFTKQISDSGTCCGPMTFSNSNTSGGSAGPCCTPSYCIGVGGTGVVTA